MKVFIQVMKEFIQEDREKLKFALQEFFQRAKQKEPNKTGEQKEFKELFSFLEKYGFITSTSFGGGNPRNYPYTAFFRKDSGYEGASYGVYCYVCFEIQTHQIKCFVAQSNDYLVKYKAEDKVDLYNKEQEVKRQNLTLDKLDELIDCLLQDLQWFSSLPLDEISDLADE